MLCITYPHSGPRRALGGDVAGARLPARHGDRASSTGLLEKHAALPLTALTESRRRSARRNLFLGLIDLAVTVAEAQADRAAHAIGTILSLEPEPSGRLLAACPDNAVPQRAEWLPRRYLH